MDVRSDFIQHYQIALDMLRQVVEKCPPERWDAPQDKNRTWRVAYHALFYALLYAHPSLEIYTPWPGHREYYELLGGKHQPPHEIPVIGDPYTKDEILACWQYTDDKVKELVSGLDLEAASGFDWLKMSTSGVQLHNIRHIQQHVGELMERIG